MTMRYHIGRALDASERALLSQTWFPLFTRFLGGRNWIYDVCRIAGTRDFRLAFDVGASIGNVARNLARFFPNADIHAFEPITATYEELRRHSAANQRIKPHRLALADAEGEARLELQAHSDLNSLHFRVNSDDPMVGEHVEITTVDKFCFNHGIDHIDILKVDAQGYDLAVLRGAAGLLSYGRIPFVLGEASLTAGDPTNQEFTPLNSVSDRLRVSSGWHL